MPKCIYLRIAKESKWGRADPDQDGAEPARTGVANDKTLAGGLERLRGDEMKLRCSLELVVLIFGLGFSVRATTPQLDSIPIPGTKAFPESITSKSDGTLYVGRLGDGGIVRINPRTHENV